MNPRLCPTENISFLQEFVCEGADGQVEVMPVSASFLRVLPPLGNVQLTPSPFSMQLWTPPTPPQDDNDLYIDSVMCLMYETTPIPESKLPPVFVRKERRRHKTDPSGASLYPQWSGPECGVGHLLPGWCLGSLTDPAPLLSHRQEEEATPRGGRRSSPVAV